ncbi:MAG: hypothetical protein MZV63_25725 [Marinilabiliales bacterium]|nr:hypothetical protein [Marinilabiliales bacterium]
MRRVSRAPGGPAEDRRRGGGARHARAARTGSGGTSGPGLEAGAARATRRAQARKTPVLRAGASPPTGWRARRRWPSCLVAAGVVVGRRLGRPDAPLSAAAKGARRTRWPSSTRPSATTSRPSRPSGRPSRPTRTGWRRPSWSSSTGTWPSSTPPSRPAGRPFGPSRTTSRPAITCWPLTRGRSRCSMRPWTSGAGTGTPRSGKR